MHLSLRYKLFLTFGLLLSATLFSYIFLASVFFRQERTATVFELSHSLVNNMAQGLRSALSQLNEILRNHTITQVLLNSQAKLSTKPLQDMGVQKVTLFEFKERYVPWTPSITDADPGAVVENLDQRFKEVEEGGFAFWSTADMAARQYFFASKIELNLGDTVRKFVALADMAGKFLLDPIQTVSLFPTFIVRANGDVMLGCDKHELLPQTSLLNHPLFLAGQQKGQLSSGVVTFMENGRSWYGAYAPVGMGNLLILSQTPQDKILSGYGQLLLGSLLFGSIALLCTHLFCIFISNSLLSRLASLGTAVRRISLGDFKSKLTAGPKDEFGDLFIHFNTMVDYLKTSHEKLSRHNGVLEHLILVKTRQLRQKEKDISGTQSSGKDLPIESLGNPNSAHQAIRETVATLGASLKEINSMVREDFRAKFDTLPLNKEPFTQLIKSLIQNSFHAISQDNRSFPNIVGVIILRTFNEDGAFFVDIMDNRKQTARMDFAQPHPSLEIECVANAPGKVTCFRVKTPLLENSSLAMAA